MIELKRLGEIKVIELIAKGENKKDGFLRVFLSKSGLDIFDKNDNFNELEIEEKNKILNKLQLYYNKNDKPILTVKREKDVITFYDYIESSFRGTSYIVEVECKDSIIASTTGVGALKEDTAFVATIYQGGYVIGRWNGRYTDGFICWRNIDGELKKYIYKATDDEDFDKALKNAKISFGLLDIEEIE